MVVALAAGLAYGPAVARPGGGQSSFGSRGSSTFSAPPVTSTAPRTAQPMQRTETPGMASRPSGAAGASAAQPRRFGFGTGLMAGLLGAGLFGMLTGHGFLGGIGGLLSAFGFLLQIALLVGLAWFAFRLFRNRSEPALAGSHARNAAPGASPGVTSGRQGQGQGQGPMRDQPQAPVHQRIEIGPEDYRSFERMLCDLQLAYGRGDVSTLRQIATPEIARYLEEELGEHRARGVRNEVSAPRLLQGDLAEAWREGAVEYATVAMRFEIVDLYRDVASGRIVSGQPDRPTEATEVWTFRRDLGAPWRLSAIQQAG